MLYYKCTLKCHYLVEIIIYNITINKIKVNKNK